MKKQQMTVISVYYKTRRLAKMAAMARGVTMSELVHVAVETLVGSQKKLVSDLTESLSYGEDSQSTPQAEN